MAEMLITVKQTVTYGGHSVRENGNFLLTLKAGYSELKNSVKLLQLLNCSVAIKAKIGDVRCKIGDFMVKGINISGDGESTMKFAGIVDNVSMDSIIRLPTLGGEEPEQFMVQYSGVVDEENAEDEWDEEE